MHMGVISYAIPLIVPKRPKLEDTVLQYVLVVFDASTKFLNTRFYFFSMGVAKDVDFPVVLRLLFQDMLTAFHMEEAKCAHSKVCTS